MEQVIEIEADSLEDARREVGRKVPAGFFLWREQVLADGKPQTATASADTEADALLAAKAQVPAGAQSLGSLIRIPPGRRTIETHAPDETSARELASREIDATQRVDAVRLKVPGRGGFLGVGRKPGVFEVEVIQSAVAAVEYKFPARIQILAGDTKLPEQGYCQACGSAEGRPRSSGGKKDKAGGGTVQYFCSSGCAEQHAKASLRALLSGSLMMGTSGGNLKLEILEVGEGDRAFCWSCGVAMGMSAKACPSCGKIQEPEA